MNLGKLVPLEVHDRRNNAKIAKKNDVEVGRALYRWKPKEKNSPTS